jgi:hypothetical protein
MRYSESTSLATYLILIILFGHPLWRFPVPTTQQATHQANHQATHQADHPVNHQERFTRVRSFDGTPLLPPHTTTLFVVAWKQPFADTQGHQSRSAYVERFWLPILGPSASWLLRSLSWGLEAQPEGYLVDIAAVAQTLGVSESLGRSGTMTRSLIRLCQFDLTAVSGQHDDGVPVLIVRDTIPWLSRRLVQSLPSFMRAEHEQWFRNAHQPRR